MTRQTFGRWALASATALLMLGCGQPPDQFIIIQNQVPSSGCVIPTTLGSDYRATGIIDVSLVASDANVGYAIFPLLENNLPAPSGGQQGDPNRIALSSYQIDVGVMEDAPDSIKTMFGVFQTSGVNGSPDQKIRYSEPTSGSVASGGGMTSSGVNGINGDLARFIRNTGLLQQGAAPFHLSSTIRAVGRTVTRSVTSDPFQFPILVCDGCLIANAVDRKVPVCPALSAPNTGNFCNVAQDQLVDCCTTNGGQLVCPAPVATK
ncbi:MAG: hypothetical protein JWM82_1922 [Myxococcales bacterium]|nr:hypothetical protein [Myxococcales bacterium]